jgi:hypothetical protein
MTIPRELSSFERWLCAEALRAEGAGPWVGRLLPLTEFALAALVAGLSIANLDPARPLIGGIGAALGGVFMGRALPDLLWPRNQRLIAALYRACLDADQGAGRQA